MQTYADFCLPCGLCLPGRPVLAQNSIVEGSPIRSSNCLEDLNSYAITYLRIGCRQHPDVHAVACRHFGA